MNLKKVKKSLLVLSAAFPGHFEPHRALTVKHAAKILSRSFNVTVVCPHVFKQDLLKEQSDNLTIIRFSYLSGGRTLKNYTHIPILRLVTYFVSGILKTFSIIRKSKPVVIYANWVIPTGIFALVSKIVYKIPFVLHAHGSDINTYAGKNVFTKTLTRLLIRHSLHVLTVSDALRQEIITKFSTLPEKVFLCKPFFDADLFKPGSKIEARNKLGLPKEKKIIIYTGDITKNKGSYILYEAAENITRKNKDVLFIFLGDGPASQQLIQYSRQAELTENILFAGAVPNNLITQYNQAADIGVLPSFSEGLPVAILESLSCGLPVIATKVGGIPEIVADGENGLLIEKGDTAQLLSCIERVISQPELLQKLTNGVRKTSDIIRLQEDSKKLSRLFEKCCSFI
ncbi:MAG: glycosyltransferase [Planctomycetota bacterium]